MSEVAREVKGVEVQEMFGSIASRYDLTNTVLSFGTHWWWRQKLKSKWRDLAPDFYALDLCTGTGDVYRDLQGSTSNVVGADFCFPMLANRKKELSDGTHGALGFIQGDALTLPLQSNHFDLVTVSFGVRNFESLTSGLHEIRRVLKPGGRLLILEFGQPPADAWVSRAWGALYQWYSKYVMPTIGGILTGNLDAYEYLPDTAKSFPCREDFARILTECGFGRVEWNSLTGGIAYIYSAECEDDE